MCKNKLLNNNIQLKKKYDERSKKKGFRLTSKNLLLTYSPCSYPINEILSQLQLILSGSVAVLTKYVVVQEKGIKVHVHVYLSFDRKVDIKNKNFFDLKFNDGNKKQIVHGNYISVKKPYEAIRYVLKNVDSKNPDILLYSPNMDRLINDSGQFMSLDESMLALAERGEIKEALELLRVEDVKRFLKDKFHLESLLRKHYLSKLGFETKFNLKDFVIPDCLQAVLDSPEIRNGFRTLFFVGGPGTGKSQFILALLKSWGRSPAVINNVDGIRFFNPNENDAIIFDDVDWSFVSGREALIKLLDSEDPCTLKINHGSCSLPKAIQRFVVSNKMLDYYVSQHFSIDYAITRRFVFYVLPPGVTLFKVDI